MARNTFDAEVAQVRWRLATHLTAIFFALTLGGCATPERRASQSASFAAGDHTESTGRVSEAELQDDLLRFESQFNAQIQSASEGLEHSPNSKIRYRAALNRLIYSSNSLGIALGPSPEANLLDMVTFIELSQGVLRRHWLPKVFGPAGRPLEQAFSDSSRQIWAIAAKVLGPKQRELLQNVISTWQRKHPDQINVETVRLSAFATEAGARAAGLDENVGGLFASVQQSTQAVDSARLFAERALYFAERAPFLFRLQARLGADEIMDDAGLNLAKLPAAMGNKRELSDLLKEVRQTLLVLHSASADARETVRSVGTLMDQVSKNPQTAQSASATITQLTALLKEWNHLLTSTSSQRGASQMAGIAGNVDQVGNQFLSKLAWIGAGLITLFWLLFFVAKLSYQYFLRRFIRGDESANTNGRGKKAA